MYNTCLNITWIFKKLNKRKKGIENVDTSVLHVLYVMKSINVSDNDMLFHERI